MEKAYQFHQSNEKIVEKILDDDVVMINHIILNTGEAMPQHDSNSNVYMTVIRGRLSIGLDDQEIHEYEAGTLLKIPFQTKMNVKNLHSETLELIVVKAPAPKI